ncbi:MAG TPA: non-ribosomal peptide synthetase [Acidobacteriaceae bacterium]|nr:non-ribosomal peptide synthetase [Acidobacteriaceae bacterium]
MGTKELANRRDEHQKDSLLEFCAFETSSPGISPGIDPGIDPWKTTILELFRNAVYRTPHAVAISDGRTSLTYAQLWNFAAAFRDRLTAQGIRAGEMVGLAADRSIPTVAAILGVLQAGACYVPLNLQEFPASILVPLVDQSGLRHWIADAGARQSMDFPLVAKGVVLPLESVSRPAAEHLVSEHPVSDQPVSDQPVAVPEAAIHPDSPLYVMFTSGSTGLPKGVVVPHRAVARLVSGQNFMQFGPDQSFLLHSPLSFDASTLELWGSLLHGSRLVVAPSGRLGLDDYSRIIREQGVTTLWLTAAIFHMAAEHTPEMFAPLNQLLFGGDVIAPHSVEQVRGLYPSLHMVNGYGPTENTTFTCCYIVPPDYRVEGSLPIGSPISHTTVYVLNPEGGEVQPGEEGELVTGGAGVALEYLAQEEASAERFVLDTFSAKPGAKRYRTGDRVRQRKDGVIEFLGRFDRQVKIAGHRVELDAIESILASSPLVVEAAVVMLTPAVGEKQLAAGVVLTSNTRAAESQLREWLRGRLSSISIPQHWFFLERLPMNTNGKLDRNALRTQCEALLQSRAAIDGEKPVSTASHARLENEEEQDALSAPAIMQFLQQLWARLLGRNSIGSDENFFDLGGTSLLLIEMHSRLRARFTDVPSLVDMFAFSTPRLLAKRLSAGLEAENKTASADQRGQRQRAALLARRGVSASKMDVPPIAKDGTR